MILAGVLSQRAILKSAPGIKTLAYLIVLMAAVLMAPTPADAKRSLSAELRHAQKALADGDYEKAFTEYHRFATEKNNPLAQFSLALFYQNGWGRPENQKKACEWFGKAAEGSVPTAAHFYAECLRDGLGGPPDPAKAAYWYEKAAKLGHLISFCSQAELYMEGRGVPKNPQKALSLCRQAADNAVISAEVRMGRFLLEGDESVRNFKEAFAWFDRAARGNSPEAQYYLGEMYYQGLGLPRSMETALYWFKTAAGQGYIAAYFPAARSYFIAPVDPESGMPTENNLAKAYMWLSATAKRSTDPDELKQTEEMLKKVLEVMPETWTPDLDARVAEHLEKYPATR